MEFRDRTPDTNPKRKSYNSQEGNVSVASKVARKIIEKYNETSNFFSYYGSANRKAFQAFQTQLAEEFGDFDPREVQTQLQSLKNLFKRKNKSSDDLKEIRSAMAFFDPATVRLDSLLSEVKKAESTEDKEAKIKKLKKELMDLLDKRQYTATIPGKYEDKDKHFVLTYNNFVKFRRRSFEVEMQSGMSSSDTIFSTYVETILQHEREREFKATMPVFNLENFEREKQTYGAKGAFLKILSDLRSNDYFKSMNIPPFTIIPVDIYLRWKSGENILKYLLPYYEEYEKNYKDKEAIVRSSAVFSEDNENSTGAGIYDSIVIPKNTSKVDFVRAILSVYKSTDAESAKKYRQEKKVAHEERMGIVIQEHIPYTDYTKGYINTIMLNQPTLMDIGYDNGLRPVIDRSLLSKKYHLEDRETNIFHYQFDMKRKSSYTIAELAELAYKLETYFRFPLQIEFIEPHELSRGNSSGTFVLQTRFLPKNFGEKVDILFPEDKTSILEGMSLGAMDQELEILDANDNNNDKEGVVIFRESEYASMAGKKIILDSFPKKGAVIVMLASRTHGGHIETLCAEKGIVLVFNTTKANWDIFDKKKVRVVSDGLEARIYDTAD